jgi:hypothetical protein
MSKQLTTTSQARLHQSLNDKIENARFEIKKKLDAGVPVDDKSVQYLSTRINQIQMSLRLTFNVDWIKEQRADYLKTLRTRLETEELLPTEKKIIEKNHASMKRASNCKKSGCWGKGYIGFNYPTGEFTLCDCTIKTLHLHNFQNGN